MEPRPHAAPVRRIWLGRERELGELEGGLDDMLAGRGGLFLITGEPGIGKTRLADEIGRAARARQLAVHWGRAWEAGGAPSYWPFLQILRGICRELEDAALAAAIGVHGPELARLMPELARRLPALTAAEAPSTGDRFPLFDAVGTFLHAAAAQRPRLLLLDDLHAANPSSLQLLQFIARDLRASRLLVVGAYREPEARLVPEVGRILAQVAREACILPLQRLTRDEIGLFVAQATGAPPSEAQLDAVHQLTEGNPLFVRELLQLSGPAGRPPEGIREVVRGRLSLLAPAARRALDAAAVLGREFEIAPFAAMLRTSEPEARALIASAADAGVIEPLQQPERWRFSHLLLRDKVYEDLAPERRAALHHAAALALKARREGDPPLAELAHHFLYAIPLVSEAEAATAALEAAAHATSLLAFEDACALLARADAQLRARGHEGRQRAQVLLALGVARIRAGDVRAGKATCLEAADLARRLGDGELFGRAVLGSACEFVPGVRDEALIARLEEALGLLPPGDAPLRARCMAQLAAERQPEPDTQAPIELARAAVAMARRLEDGDTLRFALSQAGLAMLAFADPAERLDLDGECLRLALAADDKLAALRAHLLLGADCLQLGDRAGADAHLRAYGALVQLRHSRYRWTPALLRATTALWEGRFDEAWRCYEQAMELWRQDEGSGVEMLAFPAGFARAAERYEDLPALESRLRASFGALQQDLMACVGELLIAQLYARAGDARRTSAQVRAVTSQPVFARITEVSWLALLAEPCHLLGDATLAVWLHEALLPRAGQFFWLGPLGGYYEPPYLRQLGLLARTMGRLEEAGSRLEEAEAQVRQTAMRSHLARVQYELADTLLARKGPGDAARAGMLLLQARTTATQLGQQALLPLLEACEAGTRPGDGAAGPRPPVGGEPAFSLRREGDYWTVVWGGRTVRMRDSRGLQVLEQLVARPGQELHVLQLVAEGDGRADPGDAGTVLDSIAVRSYRARLLELRAELEEAERFADAGRAEQAREEIELLTGELARAAGLGGRTRRAGRAAERARTAVQKRLRGVIRRIGEELPELGRHLEQAVRTGTFCGYLPGGRPAGRSARKPG